MIKGGAGVRSRTTLTAPDELSGGAPSGPGIVTGLALCSTGALFPLPATVARFSLGASPDCTVSIPDAYLSRLHCRLERIRDELHVTDEKSKNGTFVAGRRMRRTFVLRPGDSFMVGTSRQELLAVNDAMRFHYPELIDILGEPDDEALRGWTPSPCELLFLAGQRGHLLIASGPNSEQARLADIIHAVSPRHDQNLVTLSAFPTRRKDESPIDFRRAHWSTVVLDLSVSTVPIDPRFVAALFGSQYQIRVIALAPSTEAADHALGARFARTMRYLWLPPLAARSKGFERLIDRAFAEVGPLRLGQLRPENQAALLRSRWPEDFKSLRETAVRLTTIAEAGTVNLALAKLGVPRASFYRWYTQEMGLMHPLVLGAW